MPIGDDEAAEPLPSADVAPQPARLDHLTLDEALRIAEARQPQLLAALAAIDAAAGRYRQARTYPNPSVDLGGETLVATEIVAGFNQPVILGQRCQRAMRAATRDIEARQSDYAALHARVLWEMKQAYMQVVVLATAHRACDKAGAHGADSRREDSAELV